MRVNIAKICLSAVERRFVKGTPLLKNTTSISLINKILFRHVASMCSSCSNRFMSFLSPSRFRNQSPSEEDDLGAEYDQLVNDESHEKFARLVYSLPGVGHRVCLIQPYVKQGPDRSSKNDASLKMIEAQALIETLYNWKVVDKVIMSTKNLAQKQVFGSGNVELLKSMVCNNGKVSAVFVNINKLSGLQYSELKALFGLPVYDRFSIVLQIFKDHSRSRISKLQIAVAEIPYLKSRLKWYHMSGHNVDFEGELNFVGGANEMSIEARREMLEKRELKLREVANKLKFHRQLLRTRRKNMRLPTVAVVGYTNAGKTSLIKSLTGDLSMHPVNHLFATLDVTVHGGFLPSRMKVMYVDTVGFFSDIPTALIESFHATLEDATLADLIIHIRDLSHPETEAQKTCVLETLKMLNLPENLQENIIEVGNKIDLVPNLDSAELKDKDVMPVSVTGGIGLVELEREIERRMMAAKDINAVTFRVPNGGEESRWLYREATVRQVEADEDGQYLHMNVVIDQAMLSKFRILYPNVQISQLKL